MQRFIASCLVFTAVVLGQEYKLGSKVTGLPVQDLGGAPAAVVTFVSTQCPVSNAYNDRMSAIYKDYSAKGVKFIFLNANRSESAQEIAEHAKSVGFPFTVLKDQNNELADRFGAEVTPESYVLDSTGTLVYHGQVDDNRNQARVNRQSLRMALDALLAGKPVPVAETKAFGCTIKRAKRT